MSATPKNKTASCYIPSVYEASLMEQAAKACLESLGGDPDLVFAFVSSDYKRHLKDLIEVLKVYGHADEIIGSSGDGLIGVGEEGENISGASLLFLRFPGAELIRNEISESTIYKSADGIPWNELVTTGEGESRGWITIANPINIDLDSWVRPWNSAFPDVPTFGGLASGGPEEDDIFLFNENGLTDDSLVAVHFAGEIRLGGVVSQGCRPIGEPFTITKVARNQVLTIGQRHAFEVLEEAYQSLDFEDRIVADGKVCAGIAMNEYVDDFKSGDFQIRHILGAKADKSALALGAYPRVGQTMQFQLRDKETADEDLRRQCKESIDKFGTPLGSLVFAGAGRGVSLFGEPNHDVGVIEETFGKIPLGGLFSNGQLGPVGGRNFVHDHTVSAVFFLDPEKEEADETVVEAAAEEPVSEAATEDENVSAE